MSWTAVTPWFYRNNEFFRSRTRPALTVCADTLRTYFWHYPASGPIRFWFSDWPLCDESLLARVALFPLGDECFLEIDGTFEYLSVEASRYLFHLLPRLGPVYITMEKK